MPPQSFPNQARIGSQMASCPSPTIGLLHTVEGHVELFDTLVEELAPQARALHRVCPDLLADARARGGSEALRHQLLAELRLLGSRADALLCTCSTLGAMAEGLSAQLRVPVVRVDRPLAEAVARRGGSVAVVATLDSALESIRDLLEECGVRELRLAPCFEAWDLYESGDAAGYADRLAEYVRELAGEVDVVVLAQASMIGVEALVADLGAEVYCSPRLAVAAVASLLDRLRRRVPVAGWRA